MKIGMISLGCQINLIDTEMALGLFHEAGMQIVNNAEEADLILVNTCTHSQAAKHESVKTILDIAHIKKNHQKLVVMGCLVQHYNDLLPLELPEVDRFIAIDDYAHFGEIIQGLVEKPIEIEPGLRPMNRLLTSAFYWAYVKISDGSENHFTFCASPLIRGQHRSRTIEEIITEVDQLVKQGAKEINLISTATTSYGKDLNGSNRSQLPKLLKSLATQFSIPFIRVLTMVPGDVSNELLSVFEQHSHLVPYFDFPVLHVSSRIVKALHHKESKASLLHLIEEIRSRFRQSMIHATVIVGFPDESQEEFQELLEFIELAEFDQLTIHMYSIDEASPLVRLTDSISREVKKQRHDQIEKVAKKISHRRAKTHLGEFQTAIITGFDATTKRYKARSYYFPPDPEGGFLFVESDRPLHRGEVIEVEITDVMFKNFLAKLRTPLH